MRLPGFGDYEFAPKTNHPLDPRNDWDDVYEPGDAYEEWVLSENRLKEEYEHGLMEARGTDR